MDQQAHITKPNYKRIYSDILTRKYPEKKKECLSILKKETLSVMDILELNKKIFGIPDKQREAINRKHRSYSKKDIVQILNYQKRNNLNNIQLANHFGLSRNTVTKWKKMFQT